VSQPLGVQRLEPLAHLARDLEGLPRRECAAAREQVAQGLALEDVPDDEDAAVGIDAGVARAQHERMVHAAVGR
jgi:hypothetical protein